MQMRKDFPNLNWLTFVDKSEKTIKYNCIAFTVGDEAQRWWPNWNGCYWPPESEGVPQEETLAAFVALYGTKKYVPCGKDHSLEPGFEKVAIYCNPETQKPTHAAMQLPDGRWKSKLGRGIDIWHDSLAELAGALYGEVACCLKRPTVPATNEERQEGTS